MAAKLACSARYISGFEDARVLQDLTSYSPAFSLITLKHEKNRVIACFGTICQSSANFHPGLGGKLESHAAFEATPLNIPELRPITGTWPTGESAPDRDPVLQALTAQILEDDCRRGLDTRALIVVQGGQLLAESYTPPIQPETPLLGWSMAKSLTAILIGRMEALGLANMEASDLFPEWHNDGRSAITLCNLLQMGSGLAFDESYLPGSDVTRMLYTSPSASEYALQSVLRQQPGRHFHYSSGTTNLLALWMHRTLGGTQGCMDFLYRELLQPLRMAHTLLESDAHGVFVGSSYAYASGRDWARLGQLMLDQGSQDGKPLLSPAWVHAATTPNPSENDSRYGYQFWLNSGPGMPQRYPALPDDTYFMLGNREQKLMVCPSLSAVIVRLGWSGEDYPLERQFNRILDKLE
ncbi:serine hydrolase domain-containing protein [Microbulbifer aggregans]|uniref:serine hydrolase domain-containing protein n=1 Tax=Microbulbifer aggregans TaxID=1769779 RepID=UPI001CFED18C|nr:serine hydrolase [Microbulbifer aggregans]